MGGRFHIADVVIDPSIEKKIRENYGITGDQVREALIDRRDVEKRWENHEVHGERLVAIGRTIDGRPVFAVLLPNLSWDGTWILKTARFL